MSSRGVRELRRPLLGAVGHLLTAVAVTAPLAWRPGRLPLGTEPVATVPRFNLWTLSWTADRLTHGFAGWWDAPIFWPQRGAFAFSEPQPLTGLAFSAVRPLTGAAGGYAFLQAWNEVTVALVIMTEEQSRTLPLWLRGFVQASASRETDWGQVMAASTLVAVPVIIFFLIVQGRMSSGLVGGAVKG